MCLNILQPIICVSKHDFKQSEPLTSPQKPNAQGYGAEVQWG